MSDERDKMRQNRWGSAVGAGISCGAALCAGDWLFHAMAGRPSPTLGSFVYTFAVGVIIGGGIRWMRLATR